MESKYKVYLRCYSKELENEESPVTCKAVVGTMISLEQFEAEGISREKWLSMMAEFLHMDSVEIISKQEYGEEGEDDE